MKNPNVLFLLFLFLFSQCQTSQKTEPLTIATAANMQFAITELTEAFAKKTGIACQTVVSSSGKLMAQIQAGAPFDVFVSADMKYPTALFETGWTTAAPEVYAYGKLILWTTSPKITPTLSVLSTDSIQHIAIANPKIAPYGEAALAVLTANGLRQKIAHKLVMGESIAQTNQFVLSNAAEIGFTAQSVIFSPNLDSQGKWLALPDNLYTPIAQGVVRLKSSDTRQTAAKQFYDFLFSNEGKSILAKFGYGIPSDLKK